MLDVLKQGSSILVVDDDPLVLRAIGRYLRGLGYVVNEAATAGKAVAVMKRCGKSVRLMICDVELPDRNGLDLVQQVLLEYPRTKVLVIAAIVPEVVPINFLQKPVTAQVLEAAVRQLFVNGSAHHEE